MVEHCGEFLVWRRFATNYYLLFLDSSMVEHCGEFPVWRRFATNYYFLFLDSSMVEHSAVNRVVAGSSPARGALERLDIFYQVFFL